MTQLLPPKKEVALALLERSNVDVYLDPRAKGVVVPPQFRKEPRLILKIGLNMPVPIPDLRLDDESMSCTLSFNRSPFYCVVPWTSVFAMVGEDGRGMVWPDDVPQELAVKVVDPSSEQGRGAAAPASPSAASGAGAAGASASERGAGRRAESSRRASARERAAQAQADDTASASRAGAAGGKRKKKKEEAPARPVLVAVPNAPAPSPAIAGGPPASRPPASRPPPSRRPPAQGIDAPASSSAGRPKRELPPYLRVVK